MSPNLTIAFGFVGILMSLVFLLGSLLLFARSFRRVTLGFRLLQEAVQRSELRLEQLEKQIELTRNNIMACGGKLKQIADDINVMKEETTSLLVKADATFFLLSDRWTTADSEFLAPVRNPGMLGRPIHRSVIDSWTIGRTYVVWAPTAEIAMRHLETRFPVAGGFIIGDVVPSPLNLGERWEILAVG